ncbi:MFS transporter, partial [Streptomyces microflavus]|uniref:MFS transporter n=1 Tax=Streptomyces microflavus TaxID=1919 RepID=UPI003662C95C
MPIGLLTPLSESLDVSVGAAGLMVTAQGIAAGLGVPFIVAWSRRVNRRKLLVTLLAVLAIGNLITSIAPNYPLILGTRLIMGFASGVFWAIGVTMAMRIVPEEHANRAAAVVMSGISIATVVGIPLGTLLESAGDWRTTFLIWSALSAVVLIAAAVTVPSLPSANAVSVREVFTLPLKNVQLRLVLIMVVFFVLGHFGAYTFVRPYLEESTSATVGFITVVLIVFGIGGAVGNFIGGHTVNKSLRGSFIVGGLIMVASLVLLLTIGANKVGVIIAMILWGLAFGVVQLSQINMTLSAAPQQIRGRDVAQHDGLQHLHRPRRPDRRPVRRPRGSVERRLVRHRHGRARRDPPLRHRPRNRAGELTPPDHRSAVRSRPRPEDGTGKGTSRTTRAAMIRTAFGAVGGGGAPGGGGPARFAARARDGAGA